VFQDERGWLAGLKVGDPVHRFLGPIPMPLQVSRVTETRIHCGPWEFDRATGAEIDEDLGWGPALTGSYIRPVSS
jgi:hypothetical protein